MEELTKEQERIIEKEIRKEVKKTKTFFTQDEIDKSVFQILELINNEVKNKTKIKVEKFNNLEELIESIPSKVFRYMGTKEIKQFLSIDDIEYFQDSFYINLFGKEKIIVRGALSYLFRKYPLIFNNCIFDNEKDISIVLKQIQKLSFLNCIFRQEINLNFQECLDVFQMDNCVFKKQCKIQGTFKDKVYFDNSHFYNYVDFSKCEFEKTASFYEVKFEKIPNFSQVIFKGNLNVVNTNLNFDFDDLKDKIKQEYDFYEKARVEKETGNLYPEKSLDKFANDFRDSFRVFKNALIKDNNHLDASNFHKCELYCKEIELNFKKPKKFSKEWSDKYQLMFYRNLCDHHTDLILNLRWLIVTVGFFASILFVLRYGNGNLSKFFNIDIDLLKVLKNILNVKALNDSNAVYLIFMYSVIGLLFVRTFFILYYAVICFFYIATSSFNLFQIASFTFKSHKDCLENITIFLYIFCISLVVFSLQKTARKNSIVPS
ncbi:pentapeptide repeat-containing protein [Campylobacter molothri]|uniref:pentapeptide repeat-containing protein n=1 Tax=Campylobacter molothri TaxID=1032242 RepID=UPI00301D6115|nr:pentapeptide repeat-containing protein [Campylobacter sp. RM10542]